MKIPNELILQILESLEKYDLKSARLVSKDWSELTAPLLFDEIYVSIHPEFLEIFRSFSQHPVLSKRVKKLTYDVAEFAETCSQEHFTRSLWYQTRRILVDGPDQVSHDVNTSDLELDTWIDLISKAGQCLMGRQLWKDCVNYEFVSRAYQKYQNYASSRQARHYNAGFIETLIGGLEKLKNLSCVVLDRPESPHQGVLDGSKELFERRPVENSLARKWNVFRTWPGYTKWMPENYRPDLVRTHDNVEGHYSTLLSALIRSQRKISSFQVGRNVPRILAYRPDGRSSLERLSPHGLEILAFSELKILKISLDCAPKDRLPEAFRLLLSSMNHLEILSLDLPDDEVTYVENDPSACTYCHVFPVEGQWNQLKSLSLSNYVSNAADFLTLLTHQMPDLKILELGFVHLLTGSWPGMIECMRQSMHLTSFHLLEELAGLIGGPVSIYDFSYSREFSDPCEQIEEYVTHGGRHPCLFPDEPDTAARNFVTEDLLPLYLPVSSVPNDM